MCYEVYEASTSINLKTQGENEVKIFEAFQGSPKNLKFLSYNLVIFITFLHQFFEEFLFDGNPQKPQNLR